MLKGARAVVLGAAAAAALPASPAAEETLERVPFHVSNGTAGPIVCAAALAHWFTAEIGVAQAGQRIAATLWSDPATGTLYLRNARGEPMPVQALWCGVAGAATSTGADIPLARRAGTAEPPVDLACAGPRPDGRLDCKRR